MHLNEILPQTYPCSKELSSNSTKVSIEEPVEERIPETVAHCRPCDEKVQKWRYLINRALSLNINKKLNEISVELS